MLKKEKYFEEVLQKSYGKIYIRIKILGEYYKKIV